MYHDILNKNKEKTLCDKNLKQKSWYGLVYLWTSKKQSVDIKNKNVKQDWHSKMSY